MRRGLHGRAAYQSAGIGAIDTEQGNRGLRLSGSGGGSVAAGPGAGGEGGARGAGAEGGGKDPGGLHRGRTLGWTGRRDCGRG